MPYSFTISLSIISILFLIFHKSDSAKHCYSGQNSRYTQKQCSSGSLGWLNGTIVSFFPPHKYGLSRIGINECLGINKEDNEWLIKEGISQR